MRESLQLLREGPVARLRLDRPQLHNAFDAGLIAVMHESNVGHVTVIDLDNPERKTARSVRGFVLAAALDRGEP